MRIPIICTAALLLPMLLPAQGADQQSPAKAAVEKLTAELQKQNRDYRAARSAITKSDAYKAAVEAKDRAAMSKLLADVKAPDTKALAMQAMATAAGFQGDERVMLLSWAAVNSRDKDIITKVVDEVSQKHLGSPAVVELLENAMALSRPIGAEASNEFLGKVIEQSSNDQARAWAMYWQSRTLAGRNATDEDKQKADAMLAEAEKLAAGTDLADRIAGPRFVEERLQIGMVAPDIEGEDVDGVPFKLSDYRGKVVVLDFWGFW